jgi:hypothetical protein
MLAVSADRAAPVRKYRWMLIAALATTAVHAHDASMNANVLASASEVKMKI